MRCSVHVHDRLHLVISQNGLDPNMSHGGGTELAVYETFETCSEDEACWTS